MRFILPPLVACSGSVPPSSIVALVGSYHDFNRTPSAAEDPVVGRINLFVKAYPHQSVKAAALAQGG
jgi:hypothetical protein